MGVFLGMLLAVTAGTLNGLFALPMKAARRWAWENSWLPFSVLSLAIFPLLIAALRIPQLWQAYNEVPAQIILIAMLWGIAVYCGSLCFGISLAYIGTALAFALLVGAMSIVGVFGTIVIYDPDTLKLTGGKWIIAGVVSLMAALVFCTIAGKAKEKAQKGEDTSRIGDKVKRSALAGMILAIVGGLLSGLLPIGLKTGWAETIVTAAVTTGNAAQSEAPNSVVSLILFGGTIPNVGYCVYLLVKNKTWSRYKIAATIPNWLIILFMGLMYAGSLALWGVSTSENMLGKLGASVGWSLFVGMIVIASSIGGFATGEWKGAGKKAVQIMFGALGLIVLAMIFIGYGNYLINLKAKG